MKKEIKKTSGNTSVIFRKLSIANTVLTYLGFVILGVIAGIFIAMGIKNIPHPVEAEPVVKKGTIIVLCIMAVIALIAVASLAIGIAQSVLSKKIGTVGKLNYKGIIAILIVFLGLAFIFAIGTDYTSYLVYLAEGQSAKMYFSVGSIVGASALFTLGGAIFNTLLCVWTKPAK